MIPATARGHECVRFPENIPGGCKLTGELHLDTRRRGIELPRCTFNHCAKIDIVKRFDSFTAVREFFLTSRCSLKNRSDPRATSRPSRIAAIAAILTSPSPCHRVNVKLLYARGENASQEWAVISSTAPIKSRIFPGSPRSRSRPANYSTAEEGRG